MTQIDPARGYLEPPAEPRRREPDNEEVRDALVALIGLRRNYGGKAYRKRFARFMPVLDNLDAALGDLRSILTETDVDDWPR